MFTFEYPLLLLLILPIGALIYLTWKRMSLPYSTRQKWLILICRMLLFVCIILALAGPTLTLQASRQTTIFVGDISASTDSQRAFIEQVITNALQHKQPDDQVGIVAVGRNALVEQSVQSQIDFSRFESAPDTNYTDLAAGLRLASALLPNNTQRHVVLLSDGQQNLEDALQEAQILQQEGIRLDVIALPTTDTADARIDNLDAPTNIQINERFALHFKLYSTVAQTATVHIYQDSALLAQLQIPLTVGEQDYTYQMLAPAVGFHTYRITLEAPHDAIPQNDEASAFVNVQGPPTVLVIEGQPGSGQNIVSALKASSINVQVEAPGALPDTLDGLAPYSSIVLADVPAAELGTQRMLMIQSFVRDLGHGLIVSGGENSYGVGGYAGTPLEQTLPVNMAIPQHKETPSIAVILIVESLEEQTQINISKEAAKGVVSLLTPHDQVGISAGFGTLSIKMQYVTDKAAIDKNIDAMNPIDPISYTPDLVNAEQQLLHTNAKIKHIILLGDGDAFDNYAPTVTRIASENITVSTVETNAMSVEELGTMQQIAEWGKGRFYRADDPSAIPQILLKETEEAAQRSLINETFMPEVVENHPILTGLNGLPTLDGYVATTPKPTAQVILTSRLDDPVLAVWQYGLGRVAAWTSDALGLWTKNWLGWNNSARWWANLVTWSLPTTNNSAALDVNGSILNGTGQINVDVPPGTSASGGTQQVQARIIEPDLSQENITLQPSAPDRWSGNFAATQVGAYLLQITWQGSNQKGNNLTATAGLVSAYSPEYQTQGTDLRFLKLLAQAGGGTILDPKNLAAIFTQQLKPASSSLPIAFWLLILAALLLPIDIATRRLSNLDFLTEGYQWLRARLHIGPNNSTNTDKAQSEPAIKIAPLKQMRIKRQQFHEKMKNDTNNKSQRTTQNPQTDASSTRKEKSPLAESQERPVQTKQTVPSTTSKLVEAKRKRSQANTDKKTSP